MLAKSVGLSLALLCLSHTALAQDFKSAKPVAVAALHGAPAGRETLTAGVARLAVKAAFQPSAQPTQQELLGVILLMSLRPEQASHT